MGARLPARRDEHAFQSSAQALGGQAVPSWVDPQPVGAEDLTVGELGRSRPAHRALELTLHHRIPTALAFVEHRWVPALVIPARRPMISPMLDCHRNSPLCM